MYYWSLKITYEQSKIKHKAIDSKLICIISYSCKTLYMLSHEITNMSYSSQPTSRKHSVHRRKSLSNILCSLKGFMTSRYSQKGSMCIIQWTFADVKLPHSQRSTRPYRRGPLSSREGIIHKLKNRYFPPVPSTLYFTVTQVWLKKGPDVTVAHPWGQH